MDGTTDRVRLLGVDTPETYSANEPNEYGSITDTACLDWWGERATEWASVLEGRSVTVILDLAAGARGSYDRLLAYVHVGATDFNATLVENGLARVYTEGEASRKEEYLRLQEEARAAGEGLWACETSMPDGTTTARDDCDPAYPTVCIPSPPPDLDCGEIAYKNFTVRAPDPHRFDGDKDGVGCER